MLHYDSAAVVESKHFSDCGRVFPSHNKLMSLIHS